MHSKSKRRLGGLVKVKTHRWRVFSTCHQQTKQTTYLSERRFLMKVQMVRAKVKAEHVAEIEAAGQRLFAALERAQPQGIRYTTCLLPDGVTYVNFIALDDGVDNPLLALPEARALQEGLKNWLAEPPTSEQLTVFGSYRFF
jgi:hypothetical protein